MTPLIPDLDIQHRVQGSDVDEFRPDRHLTREGQLIAFDACPEGMLIIHLKLLC